MLRFLLRRVVLVVPTFIGVTLLSFLLIHLVPGDPIEVRVGERGVSTPRVLPNCGTKRGSTGRCGSSSSPMRGRSRTAISALRW